MILPGQADLYPAANAIQSLVAPGRDGLSQIEMFHNTPAAFHGQPEARRALSNKLRALL
jgi:hypothetical protein